MKRRFVTATALIGAASILMAACSQGGSASSEAGTSLTLRLWDDQAAQAYEAALPAFTEETGITVNVEVVPWSDLLHGPAFRARRGHRTGRLLVEHEQLHGVRPRRQDRQHRRGVPRLRAPTAGPFRVPSRSVHG